MEARNAPTLQLSTTMVAALSAGLGVLFLGLVVFIIILLVRDRREHKKAMADLEERGIAMAQTQKDAKRESVTKPRTVLRRSAILPFNSKSGWGNLQSAETINPPEPPSIPPHYAPPKPADFVAKPKRLSWPFMGRKASGKAIHMRKLRVPVLSTVIESPKPSPLVPVLGGPRRDEASSSSSPKKPKDRASSDQSLLQHHPAFRNNNPKDVSGAQVVRVEPEPARPVLRIQSEPQLETTAKPNRSQSMADILTQCNRSRSLALHTRPRLHARSVSTCSQRSGNPPGDGLPILPLKVSRIKAEANRRSLLSSSPSRLSISSFESAGSSILATQYSPVMWSSNSRVQKSTKREIRKTTVAGPRPLRAHLHKKNEMSHDSIKSSVARFSSVTQTTSRTDTQSSLLTNSSSIGSFGKIRTSDSVTLSRMTSPTGSPFAVRSVTTPKRRSGSQVTSFGSPEDRRKRSSILQNTTGNQGGPMRQLSQASTQASSRRSSNGNPFQWDPAPITSGKPSALKGSPSARKPGHKQPNCVRISLVPTLLGPQSRSPSPVMHDIKEESPNADSIRSEFSGIRSLPRPPSASIFAPDLSFSPTSIRATLAASSTALSMANYDHGAIGTPVKSKSNTTTELSEQEKNKRSSVGSAFSIPSFPSPCHESSYSGTLHSPPPLFTLLDPYLEPNDQTTTSVSASYPPRTQSLQCSVIPEEAHTKDSPPCSPKTTPKTTPRKCEDHRSLQGYNLPISNTTIPEHPFETIDPAVLCQEAFSPLNNPFDMNSSILGGSSSQNNMIPSCPSLAVNSFQPLLDAAFPSSMTMPILDSSLASRDPQSDFSNMHGSVFQSYDTLFSSPIPTLLPNAPTSPRPAHAQLPTPIMTFNNVPTSQVNGPRHPPPTSPLRLSIQTLRRMNSDTKKGGRAEQRYIQLGREQSVTLPGDESWIRDLDAPSEEEDETWSEEKERRLVGDLLNDWEEDAAALGLDSPPTLVMSTRSPTTSPTQDLLSTPPVDTTKDDLDTSAGAMETSTPPRPFSPTGASNRASSIWEDGEKFWTSTPGTPTGKACQASVPLASSPMPVSSPRTSRKRQFEVARDEEQEDYHEGKKLGIENFEGRAKMRDRNRKRSVLGVGTPNVRVIVSPPSGGNTPGSLYDTEGFLRS